MPKVSKEYFDNKRKIILDAALKVFSKKPSYTVSMKDIIKESKLSHGGVYKYYSNIDDIIISLINRNEILVNPKDIIKNNYDYPEKAIFEFLEAYKNYFFEATKEYGKIFFELYPILINDKKRLKIYARKISENINFAYWIETLFIYFDKKINERYFNPITTSQNIYMQIVSMLKGIEMELILTKYYNKNRYYKIDLETKLDDLVETIYKTILFLMGNKIKNKEIKKK